MSGNVQLNTVSRDVPLGHGLYYRRAITQWGRRRIEWGTWRRGELNPHGLESRPRTVEPSRPHDRSESAPALVRKRARLRPGPNSELDAWWRSREYADEPFKHRGLHACWGSGLGRLVPAQARLMLPKHWQSYRSGWGVVACFVKGIIPWGEWAAVRRTVSGLRSERRRHSSITHNGTSPRSARIRSMKTS